MTTPGFVLMLYISILPIVFGIIGLLQFKNSPFSRILFLNFVCLSLWQIDVSILYCASFIPKEQALFWFKVLRIGTTFPFVAVLFMFYQSVKSSNIKLNGFFKHFISKRFLIFFTVWTSLVYLIGLTPYEIKDLRLDSQNFYYPIYGSAIDLFYFHTGISLIGLALLTFFAFKMQIANLRSFFTIYVISVLSLCIIGTLNFSKFFMLFPSSLGVAIFVTGIFFAFNHMQKSIIEDMHEQMEKRSKMQYFDMNTSGLIHELKNPFSAIQGYTEIIPYVKDSEEELNEVLKNLSLANQHMSSIIQGFSEFIKTGKAELKTKSIVAIAEESIEILRNQADQKQVHLNLFYKKNEEFNAYVDEDKFRQVLINLCKNSMDAIPENSSRKEVSVYIQDKVRDIVIDVTDSGSGIPKAKWSDIFKPFETTKESGMGLGLSIVYRIVLAHGGTIEILESDESGTTIRVTIPKTPYELLKNI